jgi:hypothetical protein
VLQAGLRRAPAPAPAPDAAPLQQDHDQVQVAGWRGLVGKIGFGRGSKNGA